ncbi:tetratricopeptide repeat protein [Streptomyces camelliae]|uniref:Tetratricopeptide repeat protein n=1 Tax=Streptomyces camelliae TaxID=3004093 RepID=A0ABY7NZG1_9ACTN|nr:tetratricopeptide repeat protein [Streptomyces sp. HUAS 2-6]WBO63624.1 tetratricopeptide repeat protein [Streptomyces sp. HUAS 2-6]
MGEITDFEALRRAMAENSEQPEGPARNARAEQLLADAERLGIPLAVIEALGHQLKVYNYSSEKDRMFVPFARLLRMWDERPEDFDAYETHALHWVFKWMSAGMLDQPHVPLASVEKWLGEMAHRYRLAGHSERAVHSAEFSVAAHIGDLARAERAYDAWLAADRDEMADCHACELHGQGEWQVTRGRDAEALELWRPVLEGEFTCAHEPHTVLASSLVPLLRLGRVDEARAHHLRGFRLVRPMESMRAAYADHVEFCALTGNEARGLELLAERPAYFTDTGHPRSRLDFLAVVTLLMDRLTELGLGGRRVPGPAGRSWTADELGAHARVETLELAERFDRRNGTSYVGDRARARMARRPLVDRLPLGVRTTRTAPAPPQAPPPPESSDLATRLAEARHLSETLRPHALEAWAAVAQAAEDAELSPRDRAEIADHEAMARGPEGIELFERAAALYAEAGDPGEALAARARGAYVRALTGEVDAALTTVTALYDEILALYADEGTGVRQTASVVMSRARILMRGVHEGTVFEPAAAGTTPDGSAPAGPTSGRPEPAEAAPEGTESDQPAPRQGEPGPEEAGPEQPAPGSTRADGTAADQRAPRQSEPEPGQEAAGTQWPVPEDAGPDGTTGGRPAPRQSEPEPGQEAAGTQWPVYGGGGVDAAALAEQAVREVIALVGGCDAQDVRLAARAAEARGMLGELAGLRGDAGRAAALFREAVGAYIDAGLPWFAVEYEVQVASLAHQAGDAAGAERALRSALEHGGPYVEPVGRAQLHLQLAEVVGGRGEVVEAAEHALQAAHWADEAGESGTLGAWARQQLGGFLLRQGRCAEAAEVLESALTELSAETHGDGAVVQALWWLGDCLGELGDHRAAAERRLRAAEFARHWPEQQDHATLAHLAAESLGHAGLLAEAEQAYARAGELWRALGNPQFLVRSLRARAWLALREGAGAESGRALMADAVRTCEDALAAAADPVAREELTAELGTTHRQFGDLLARSATEEADEEDTEGAEDGLIQGAFEAALGHMDRAAALFGTLGADGLHSRTGAELAAGWLEANLGRPAEAITRARAVLAAYEDAGDEDATVRERRTEATQMLGLED